MALELPLLVIDVQRGGPSTGLPTKTEQADLLQAMFGRNGEAPVPIVAPQSPSDCFDAAIEAARIALTYRTPVILLSDGYLANGSEPWRVPDVADLPDLHVEFATEPNHTLDDGTEVFWPFKRDPETLARPWAIPGTPGLEHRIGGIEKADGSGAITYDPDNHDFMVRMRQAKVDGIAKTIAALEVDDPDGDARVLVLGWGSTYGPIGAACGIIRAEGGKVAQAHLRHLNPFPANTGEVLRAYDRVLIPEMNLGPAEHAHPRQVPGRRPGLQPGPRPAVQGHRAGRPDQGAPVTIDLTTSHVPEPRAQGRRARSRPRTSRATRRCAGAPAAGTTRSWPRCRRSCPSWACAGRTSCSSPASAARRGSRTT